MLDFSATLRQVRRDLPQVNPEKLKQAYYFVEQAHAGQKRYSGEPFVIHPVEVFKTLVNLKVDEDTLVAALLHDVIEDTGCSQREIKEKFGKEVAFLVMGVTKLSKIYYKDQLEERKLASLQRVIVATAKDVRVILIKLADRLHNVQTLSYLSEVDRKRITHETQDIYIPLAYSFGLWCFAAPLEEMCFKYLNPQDFRMLQEKMTQREKEKQYLQKFSTILKRKLKENKLDCEVEEFQKYLFEIAAKLKIWGKTLEEVWGLGFGIRVVTRSTQECYEVMGIIHNLWKPKLDLFRDYIALPKANDYRAIHTTVFCSHGHLVPFQVCSRSMHLEAEYGVAAYFWYKAKEEDKANLRHGARWLREVLELQKYRLDGNKFLDDLKDSTARERISVFTPKGDLIDLPLGATAVDFAYAVHSEIGNHAILARVDGKDQPLNVNLKTSSIIEIITDKSGVPVLDWLSYAKTNTAKRHILDWFKKESREQKLRRGKKLLQSELDQHSRGIIENLSRKCVTRLLSTKDLVSFEDALVCLGEGSLNTEEVYNLLFPTLKIITRNKKYSYYFKIIGKERPGFLRDLIVAISTLGISVSSLIKKPKHNLRIYKISLETVNQFSTGEIVRRLKQINGVISVRRVSPRNRLYFLIWSLVTVIVWLAHPYLVFYLTNHQISNWKFVSALVSYMGLFLILVMIHYLKSIVEKRLPEARENFLFWPIIFFVNLLALATVLSEIILYRIQLDWLIVISAILILYSYLILEYLDCRK
ncbi:(p)ppGpp synthetase [Candidatus Peregrinibacteria bacterium CG08_land_8_20_14_0_20_41_10]|nr:MAG: (p)ppGpp synthetase [Candidatus Peregrinibacteria bacterium CG08_land_8_20_14_0_20_41_10]